ncbi:MAG: aromatic ring-hydroxylating dioxygenase subunit alpha [Pirellulales bacterium]
MLYDLIRQRPPSHSLPQAFYVEPGIFDLDVERIFRRHWLLAGPECLVPGEGDYFTYGLANDSIVIVRGPAGRINAFHNVCRHRGSRICLEEQGHARRLVCPYHHWSYGLDGALCSARQLPAEIDPATLGLHPVHVQVVEGLIFVCLADRPPNFTHTAADLSKYLQPHGLDRTAVCRRTVERIQANWKVVAENFWECYHCAPTHPEFCSVMSYAHAQNNPRLAEQRRRFEREWAETARQKGRQVGRVELSARGLHQGGRVAIQPGYVTQSQDGQPLAPLLGDYTEYDGGITSFMHLPLIWYVVSNDHAMLTRFTPISPLETELELTWLVHADAVAGRDYDADKVCWLWQTTAVQDKTICENNQRGILSSRYRPGPYTANEQAADAFVTWYLKEIALSGDALLHREREV